MSYPHAILKRNESALYMKLQSMPLICCISSFQVWDFKVILAIDITGHEENRSPIDASGVFEFDFKEFSCPRIDEIFDKNQCVPLDDEPAKVAALITIQTVVFVQDEEEDQIAIMLVALKGKGQRSSIRVMSKVMH